MNTYLELFAMESGNRARFNDLTNACINWRLQSGGFGVRAKSVVEYCDATDTAGKVTQDGMCACVCVAPMAFDLDYKAYLSHR